MTNTSIQQTNNLPQIPYKLLEPLNERKENKPLDVVVGLENQKEELLKVISWFKNAKELKAKGLSIPKGVVLFGLPGNGKSLLIKEIIKCIDAPVFIFQGDQLNVSEGIVETFNKARETGHAVIVIDELDLLINRERRVIRVLQECLDGVESNDDILVLTATNDVEEIPEPLLRSGRLEKLIEIPWPKEKDIITLFKRHFKEFNVKLPDDFDEEEVALTLNCVSCASIKAIVNDVVLRNGFENITVEMIDESIANITDRVKTTNRESTIDVAIHEAGHALMARAFPKHYILNRLNLNNEGGQFYVKEVQENFWPYDKVIAHIKISLAGVIAQKVLCGTASRGCERDLQTARINAYNLFNLNGYSSCWETLPIVKQGARMETFIKKRKMERKIEKLLRKCEREVTSYIKKYKEDVRALGTLLLEKKHLKSSEILSCINK